MTSWGFIKVSIIRRIILAAILAFSANIWAQDAQDEQGENAEDAADLDRIIVTGSRIQRDDFSSASPIHVIDMETSSLAGVLDVSDILQGSTIAASAAQWNNQWSGYIVPGGSGTNTVDLRGLGPGKTLVLMNGRRLNPAGTRGTVAAVDLNTLPISVIQRIEILKDGASSVYGSDAVAGVVNIITKSNMDGFATTFQASIPTESGGEIYSADLAYGLNTDTANIVFGVEVFERKDLTEGDRDWSTCTEENYFDPDTGEDISTVDPTTGEVKCWNAPANDYVVVSGGDYSGRWIRDESAEGPVPGWRIGSLAERKFDNERQRNASLLSPVKRINFFSFGEIDLEILDGATAYYEFTYNDRQSEQHNGPRQFAPAIWYPNPAMEAFSPFYDGGGIRDLPLLLPFDYISEQEVTWTRAIAGLNGYFNDNWSFDIYYAYGRSHGTYSSQQLLADRIVNTLDVVEVSPGVYDCAVNQFPGADPLYSAPCVPFDPYSQIGRINDFDQDVLEYITSYETGKTTYTQNLIDGHVSGELFSMPAGPVGGVLGFQYREEKIKDVPSSGSIARNLWGFTSAGITEGTEKVNEVYGELELPLLAGIPAIQYLNMTASARYTDYKTIGSDTTWKIGLNWQIIDQLRLRGTYGTSFRAPSLYESFLNGQTGFSNAGDPCEEWDTTENPGSNTYINCEAEGVPLDHQGFTSTPEVITYGNAGRLRAETSDNYTFGGIVQLDFGLSFALDYFSYDIVDEIDRFGAQSILNQCYSLAPSLFREPGTICDFISPRSPVDQNINEINDSYFNINQKIVKGYDFTLRYDLNLGDWDFIADFNATKITDHVRTLFGDVEDDLLGTIGYPEWNALLNLTGYWHNWMFFYRFTWIGDMEDYTYNEIDPAESVFILDTPDVYYHNVSARYTWDRWSVQLGISNLTDEDPPIVSDVDACFAGGVGCTTQWDFRGRAIFFGVSLASK